MPLVVAYDEIKPEQRDRAGKTGKPGGTNTTFFRARKGEPDGPSAYINRYVPGRLSHAHYHLIDQFQIIVDGKGEFGRHQVEPYCVHFSRAYTPYGPLKSDDKDGWAFLVLRAHYDPGHNDVPEMNDELKKVSGRQPWQITKKVSFPALRPVAQCMDIAEIKDDQGLFTKTLTMPPRVRTTAPSPANGDGQFIVVTKGSLLRDNKEHKALSVVFLKPDELAFEIQSGPEGLQGMILNLPKVQPRKVDAIVPSTASGYKKWQCVLCSFAYDEAAGMPADGIAAGTRWEDVPATWTCPDCSASKSDFDMVVV